MKLTVTLRPMISADRGFIVGTWLRNYARTREAHRVVPEAYHAGQTALIDELLDREETILAVNPEKSDQIFGFICGRRATLTAPGVVHYAYVKDVFRRKGVGRLLVTTLSGGAPVDFTHVPPVVSNLAASPQDARDTRDFPDVETLLRKLAPGSHYNPYWLTVGVERAGRSTAGRGRGGST